MQHGQIVARVRKRYRVTSVAPNQRWVGDTTELNTPSGKLYLAAVVELFSRFVVGWAVSAMNNRHLTIKALEMAIRRRCPDAGLLHHSDQGSTYASEDYQRLLALHGITCSMSRLGNCYDNAVMESWFSTLKFELGEHFETAGDAKARLFDYSEVFKTRSGCARPSVALRPPSSREQPRNRVTPRYAPLHDERREFVGPAVGRALPV